MQSSDYASQIAQDLLQIKAVRLSTEEPFTWSSGWKSPIYCDNRMILSYPEIRTRVRDAFVERIRGSYSDVEGVAGVATGGIAVGALVAEQLGLPFIYVRPTYKSHGLQNQIEGKIDANQRFVVIEDLVSTGSSSARAVEALQKEGAEVLGTIAIFGYGFPEAEETFAMTGTSFQTLTHMEALLQEAAKLNYLKDDEKETVRAWSRQPDAWEPVN